MAKAPPMGTGFEAVRIAWPAYLIPFLFAFSPALLMEGSALDVAATLVTAGIGVYFVTVGIVGFLFSPLSPLLRSLAAIGGVCVLLPWGVATSAIWINLGGLAALIALVLGQLGQRKARSPLTD